jgi:hypothetical protein
LLYRGLTLLGANMRPVWLIEAGVYGAEADPLLEEVRRQGMAAELVPFRTVLKEKTLVVGRPLADGDCVIGYGTFPFARQIQLHRRWLPGAWCAPENLDCTRYFAYFGKFLLNQQYAILPGVEAVRQQDWLFGVFGRDDVVFARPTGCNKLFTGRCIARDDFTAALAPARYDPATLVVVAAPKEIAREWRLVVAEDQVIAASQYSQEGSRSVAPNCPPGRARLCPGDACRGPLAAGPDLHDGRVRIRRAVAAHRVERLQLLLAVPVRPGRRRGRGEQAGHPGV